MGEQLCRFAGESLCLASTISTKWRRDTRPDFFLKTTWRSKRTGKSSADNTTRKGGLANGFPGAGSYRSLGVFLDHEDAASASKEGHRTITVRYRRAVVQEVGD